MIVDRSAEVPAPPLDCTSTAYPTVLVVDDEPCGEEALRALAGHEAVHLLLTDLRMPVMSGTQLAAEANRLRPHALVLLMAAYPAGDTLPWRVLVKPFVQDQLVTEVRRVLDEAT